MEKSELNTELSGKNLNNATDRGLARGRPPEQGHFPEKARESLTLKHSLQNPKCKV